jgi:hypothetical protein
MLPHQLMNVTCHVFKTKKKIEIYQKKRKWININKDIKKTRFYRLIFISIYY